MLKKRINIVQDRKRELKMIRKEEDKENHNDSNFDVFSTPQKKSYDPMSALQSVNESGYSKSKLDFGTRNSEYKQAEEQAENKSRYFNLINMKLSERRGAMDFKKLPQL